MKTDKNNFYAIKFLAALFVIISHAYSLTMGPEIVDPLYEITKGSLSFGSVSVAVFMFLSGYFITKSLNNNSTALQFFQKRIIRIFPSLFFVLVLTVFIIGPIFSTVSLRTYFFDDSPYLYFIKNIFLITTHKIIGVFSGNPYNLSINGALWTLPIEFLCYISSFIFYKIGVMEKKKLKYTILPVIFIFIFRTRLFNIFPIIKVVFPLLLMFYIGILFYNYDRYIIRNRKNMFLLTIVAVLLILFKLYDYFLFFLSPLIIIYLGYGNLKIFKKLNIFGKFTYEIYLIGFVLQQIIVSIFGGVMNTYLNIVLTFVTVIPISIFINKLSSVVAKQLSKKEIRL